MSAENIFVIVDNKEYRVKPQEGAPAELGKRFVCGLELERQVIQQGGKLVTETIYRSGELSLADRSGNLCKAGEGVFKAGCGTEFLVTKASPSIIECCGKPAVLQKPKPLLSSD